MSLEPRNVGLPTRSSRGERALAAVRSRIPIARMPQPLEPRMRPTWPQAKPSRISAALAVAQSRDPGGWLVVGSSSDVGSKVSVTRNLGGREIVLWRDSDGSLVAGPGACPHLGALLTGCRVNGGTLYCRWHGYPLTAAGDRSWRPLAAHDDGVLIWARVPLDGEQPTDRPALPVRPSQATSVAAVVHVVGRCEPQDVIANRLDPWHGAWFHPYSFSHLVVDDAASDDRTLTVDVTFRLGRTWGVPVRAEFTCPDARTIVMTITDGEGEGSVVETHATPLAPGADGRPRTMITEATIAKSDRAGFAVARFLAPALRPAMKRTAARLWVDDLAYAERRYALRARGEFPG